ncbi:MFS transporter [Kitasatospora purpeofusca]|uniref:MFS transporter n=1 Tax=Kitasatospora purpeofusca TaxID=67352 RepID=UPI00068D8D46|nr:MFS transporter [Kitasatospora purpeofusca]
MSVASCNQNPPRVLTRPLTLLFALASGAAVANVYAAQPLLVAIADELDIGRAAVGAVVTCTQIGYGLGLVLLVPLGDLLERRRLVTAQAVLLALALAAVATAGNAAALLAGLMAVGLLAVLTQALVAFASALAPDGERGRVVGTVTGGVVLGILLARTVAGAVADLAGWRAVYALSALLTLVLAAALRRALPRTAPPTARRADYRRALRSLVRLPLREPVFRRRGLITLLVFAAFSTLWSSVALPLSDAPYSLTPAAVGAFGLAGAAGAAAAAPAGRLFDRGLGRWTAGAGLALLALSWLPLALTRQSLWALALGAVLLDFAVQAVHVTNQSTVLALDPAAGGRLIGGYMVFYSLGSALGAITSTAAYAAAGWSAVCLLGTAFSLLALLAWAAWDLRPAGTEGDAPQHRPHR